MSIKVQEFRSRYAKYVYYNCSRVVCECHGYKRDREPSRVPVNMLKRLSQKSKKLQSYVWSRLRKNVPKSSKVHRLIKNVVTRRKSRHKTRVRLVQKIRRKPIFRTKKKSILQWDMLTSQIQLNMERNISNTQGCFRVSSLIVSTRV